METSQVLRPVHVTYWLRATAVTGRELEPIPCDSEEEAETRASALLELGYLNPRVRVTKRS